MGLINLLQNGISKLGWNGGKVPSSKVSPIPPGSVHNTYSVDGNPNITLSAAGFVPSKPSPSKLDEADGLNTSKYRNKKGGKYTDNLPK